MRSWFKALAILLSALFSLAVISLILPDQLYKRAAEIITPLLTGRELSISTISIQRGLQTVIEASDISFANAEWSDEDVMLEVERLKLSIDFRALLDGMLEISSLSFLGLNIHLEKNTQGQFNWRFSENNTFSPDLTRLNLIDLSANKNVIQYTDHATGSNHKLALSSLNLQAVNHTRIPAIAARGEFNSVPVVLNTLLQHPNPLHPDAENQTSDKVPVTVEASIGDVIVTANGDIDTSDSNVIINGEVSMHLKDLQDAAEIFQIELPTLGPIDVTANVTGNLSNISDDGIDATLLAGNKQVDLILHQARLESDQLNVNMSGEINDVLNTVQAKVDIGVDAPDMTLITTLFGQRMPPEWGPVSASGHLSGSHGRYAVNQIDAKLNGNSTAIAIGSIASLMPFDNMHLDVQANLFSLTEVSAYTPEPLPGIGPFSGNGTVIWKNEKLSLVDAKANYNGPLGIVVATGSIGDLIRFDGVRLRADADLTDFKALDLFTGFTMPQVDGVVVSTNLFSIEALDLSARNLNVTARKDNLSISAEGSADSIFKNKGILDLKLATQVESISQLESLVKKDLPDIGPISGTAQLSGSRQNIKLIDVELMLNDPLLSGTLSADVGYLDRIEQISINTQLKTISIKDTLEKFSIHTDVSEPAALSSQVHMDVTNDFIGLENTRLTIADNTLTGELDLFDMINPEKQSRIAGTIDLMDLNIMDLRDRPMGIRSKTNGPTSTMMTGMLLSDTALPWGTIARNDIDLKIQVDNFMSTLLDVSDATLNLQSKDGLLTVGPFSGMVNQGQAELHMVVDTRQNPPSVSLTANLKNFDLARAGLLQNSNLIENTGGTTVMLQLDGHGDSIADILASANGEGGLYIEDLVLKQGILRVLSSDLLDQLVDAIDPSKVRSDETHLLCSALAFQLDNGKLDTPMGFAIESDKFAILGKANLNFNDESINVMINSKPRKGLGFSLNRFVNLVEIEGQLATPKLSLSESGLLRLGASLAAAVASSGVTLLAEGLWERQQANSNVCAQALGK